MKAKRLCSYPVLYVNFKGAVLMIWVSAAIYIYRSHADIVSVPNDQSNFFFYMYIALQIFFPLFGWIADAWIGRYKTILYSLCLLVLASISLTASVIINDFQPLFSQIFLHASNIFNLLGTAAIYANMLPFITDQMIGASGDELSAAVHWWYWSEFFPFFIAYSMPCILHNTPQIVTSIFLSFTGLAIALSSLFICQHLLDKTPQITNPIKHIAKVINYARKNKYSRNRSALTYWEQDIPSRLDLGKDKYGGPFSEEEVENVKTTLRLIPVIFICSIIGLAVDVTREQQSHMTVNSDSILACFFVDEERLYRQIIGFGIPLYRFIIRPLLRKITMYTPSMLTVIGAGFFFKMSGTIGMAAIETVGHLEKPNVTCIFKNNIEVVMSLNYYWTIIPQMLEAFGRELYIIALIEFIIAQSPLQTKGFLLGLFYGFSGTVLLIGSNLDRLFLLLPHSFPISCGFYYYLTHTFLLLLLFVVFYILSKHYKLRVRNNPVNIHMIVETHITAYIDQEEEYFKEIDEENYSSINSSSNGIFGTTYN